MSAVITQTSLELDLLGESPEIERLADLGIGQYGRVGDQIGKTPAQRKHSAWSYESPLARDAGLGEHMREVLSQLAPIWLEVVRAAATGRAQVSIALYVGQGRQPEWSLSKEQVSQLAELGAEIVVDIYNWVPTSKP